MIVDSGTPGLVIPDSLFNQVFGNIEVASDCSNLKDLPDV